MAHFYYVYVNTKDEHASYGPFENPYMAHHAVHVIADRQKSYRIVSSLPSRVSLRSLDEKDYTVIQSRSFSSVSAKRINAFFKILKPFK